MQLNFRAQHGVICSTGESLRNENYDAGLIAEINDINNSRRSSGTNNVNFREIYATLMNSGELLSFLTFQLKIHTYTRVRTDNLVSTYFTDILSIICIYIILKNLFDVQKLEKLGTF